MRSTLRLVITLALTSVSTAMAADSDVPQRLTATVRLARDQFLKGEPIGVVLTVKNPGPRLAHVQLNYPLMFTHGMSLVQFDAGPSIPALPIRLMGLSGSFLRFDTEVPAGTNWSGNVYLQNYVQQPPPGVHQVKYVFQTSYLLREPDARDNAIFRDDDVPDHPLIKAEGSLTVRVTEPDPAALERVLDAVVMSLRAGGASGEPNADSKWQAIEALKAVHGPVVIPHVVEALKAIDPSDLGGYDDLFDILARSGDLRETDRAVLNLVDSRNGQVAYRAVSWLRRARVRVKPDVLVSFFDRALAAGSFPQSELLRYLHDVPVEPTPPLRDRVRRCLSNENLVSDVALALVILSGWHVPKDAEIQDALDRLAGSPGVLDSSDDSEVIEALGAWRIALGVEKLRPQLQARPVKLIPNFESFLKYLRAFPPDQYRALEPQVASLLFVGRDDGVMLEALRTLDRWGHVLTPGEVKWLMDQEAEVRDATQKYVDRRAVH